MSEEQRTQFYTGKEGSIQGIDWIRFGNRAYEMDKVLFSNLEDCYAGNHSGLDTVILITGLPGSGKSTLGWQIADFFSFKEDIPLSMSDNIQFTSREFLRAISKPKHYEVCMYDESRRGFNVKRTMSFINQALMNKLNEIRRNRKYIIIITPRFKDLMEDIAVDRSQLLINCNIRKVREAVNGEEQTVVKRGSAFLYGFWKKDDMFAGRRKWSNHKLFLKFRADAMLHFQDYFPGPEKPSFENYALYEKLKVRFLNTVDDEEDQFKKDRFAFLLWSLVHKYGMNAYELAEMSAMSPKGIYYVLEKAKMFDDPANRPAIRIYAKRGGVKHEKKPVGLDTGRGQTAEDNGFEENAQQNSARKGEKPTGL